MSLLIALLVALAASFATYRGYKPLGLFALRFVASFLLVLSVLGVSVRLPMTKRPSVWLYRDISPSMRRGKWEWADSTFSKLRKLASKSYFFSDSVYPVSNEVKPVGNYTDLSLPIRQSKGDVCLIITDGLHNSSENLYTAASDRGKPVLFIVPPYASTGIDLAVQDVMLPSVIRVGEQAHVVVKYSLSGVDSTKVHFAVTSDTVRVVDTTFVARNGLHGLSFPLSPLKQGLHLYTLGFDNLEGEVDTINNRQQIGIKVVKSKSSGVLLATHPDPIVRLIRWAVDKEKYADIDVFVQTAGGKWEYLGPTVSDSMPPFRDSDFLILIDPDVAIMDAIKKLPPDKIAIVPGRNSVKAHVMGFTYGGKGRLSPGRNWSEIGSEFKDWSTLPQLRLIKGGNPLKEFINIGKIPAVFTDSKGYIVLGVGRFWIVGLYRPQLFYDLWQYILTRISHPGDIFFIYTEPGVVYQGQKMRIIAEAYDGFGNPINNLAVNTIIDSDTVALAFSGDGKYVSVPLQPSSGKHKVTGIFYRDTLEVGRKADSIEVLNIPIEMLQGGVDTLLPKSVARLTGGRLCHSTAECEDFVKNYRVKRTFLFAFDSSLWVLLLAISLFGVEWYLRKERGMA